MPDIKILFLHGLEGTPEGTKPKFLKEQGYRVVAPVLPRDNWDLSVKRAEDCFLNFRPDIVVGSSRGGAVATAFPTGDVPKILIAPAYKKFGVKDPIVDKTTTILHYADDKLVPYEDSIKLCEPVQNERFGPQLIECGSSHRMSDEEALGELLNVIRSTYVGA